MEILSFKGQLEQLHPTAHMKITFSFGLYGHAISVVQSSSIMETHMWRTGLYEPDTCSARLC